MTQYDLVLCSLEAWDDVWRRNQFLVAGLLDRDPDLRVLFVEPAADPLHALRSGRVASRGVGLRPAPDLGPRLHLLQPTKWLPRSLGPVADRGRHRQVLAAVGELGMPRPLLWVNDPGWAGLTERVDWPALYDITDDWLVARRSPRQARRLLADERRLMATCREVVVCSPALVATKGQFRPVRLVPNAVDVDRFRTPQPRPADLPDGPLAVYVGTFHEDRLDLGLCCDLGRELQDHGAGLVLVGPVALSGSNTDRLRSTPGVTLLGPRPNHLIPAYLQHANVLVVPHVVDDFTDSLDPIKMYEYQAVARPIVSTSVAGFRDLAESPGILVADDEAFVSAVQQAIATPPAQVGPFAVPDWGARVTSMAQLLEGVRSSAASRLSAPSASEPGPL